MTNRERVSNHRAIQKSKNLKIVEVTMPHESVIILDALASKNGCSRSLFISTLIRTFISESGYTMINNKLYKLS